MEHGKDSGKSTVGDGKGTHKVPEKTPLESVDVQARTDTPGGESSKGSGIEMQGPNAYKK